MSGMVKAKKYDWKDSNMALFGSDLEKNIKKASAECEEAWQGTGKGVELKIWRIEKFKVVAWPEEEYGSFFDGDSYIILNCYKKEDQLLMDVHFWIGIYSSQDEYGTAAYKTVELDNFHDDLPVQHREVQGYESEKFLRYFDKFGGIRVLKGGVDSGFRHVTPEEYGARLIRVNCTKHTTTHREVKYSSLALYSDDAFVVDGGLKLFVWQGKECNFKEKNAAVTHAKKIQSDRNGRPSCDIVAEGDEDDAFWEAIGGNNGRPEGNKEHKSNKAGEKKLIKVSDASGEMTTEEVASGDFSKDSLKSEDVFIVDTGLDIFSWVGSAASDLEKKMALMIAIKYANGTDHPFAPVTAVYEGKESSKFNKAFV